MASQAFPNDVYSNWLNDVKRSTAQNTVATGRDSTPQDKAAIAAAGLKEAYNANVATRKSVLESEQRAREANMSYDLKRREIAAKETSPLQNIVGGVGTLGTLAQGYGSLSKAGVLPAVSWGTKPTGAAAGYGEAIKPGTEPYGTNLSTSQNGTVAPTAETTAGSSSQEAISGGVAGTGTGMAASEFAQPDLYLGGGMTPAVAEAATIPGTTAALEAGGMAGEAALEAATISAGETAAMGAAEMGTEIAATTTAELGVTAGLSFIPVVGWAIGIFSLANMLMGGELVQGVGNFFSDVGSSVGDFFDW